MKKTHENNKETLVREFTENFIPLAQKYGDVKVWGDFIIASACAISTSADHRFFKEREGIAGSIFSLYTEEECAKLMEMFRLTSLALMVNPEQDFLGDVYEILGLSCNNLLTAEFIGHTASDGPENKPPFELGKPGERSGAWLIKTAYERSNQAENFDEFAILAHDIDPIAALTCYVQLSLIGYQAIVKVGGRFMEPFVPEDIKKENVWLSPMFISETRQTAET